MSRITPYGDPSWLVVEEGFDLAREHEVESLLAVGNGYIGTRGSLAEGSSLSAPATFIAGIYDVGPGPGAVPALVAAPDWMRLHASIDGSPLLLEEGEILEHRRILDMRQGIHWREWRHRDHAGRITRLRGLRLASLADRHALAQVVEFTPENYSARVQIEGRIEGRARAVGPTAVDLPGVVPLEEQGPEKAVLVVRTRRRDYVVAFAAWSALGVVGRPPVPRQVVSANGGFVERWDVEAEIGTALRLERMIAVRTSRDAESPAEAAATHLERLRERGVERVLADHVAAWEERWRDADVEIEGDDDAQRALRFAAYHLISAANPEDERVSIGARTLTGSAYKGHVFWDTEIYMLPFFVLTHPKTARALLMYRYHTLPAAREKASALGWEGALYAWESADTGEEVTPRVVLAPDGEVVEILNGEQEIHISAAVAWAVWHYWTHTADDDFLRDAGAEILLETARFWASRGERGDDGLYHIRHVIGPDEYHVDVDDNAYTNVMAQWNLERGAEAARILERRWPGRWQELRERLGLSHEEIVEWSELARMMYTGFDPETGLFEQFRGYFELEDIDLREWEPRTGPIDILIGMERTQRSQVHKQADVVLLLALFWDRFPPEVREANFRYYEPRCGHGSSLSPSIHALVAARLGDVELARRYFRQAAEIDLANNMGNAAGGVHAAALGGLWQAAVYGFGGLRFTDTGPSLDPKLLPEWHRLRFAVRWRGRRHELEASGTEARP